MVLPPEAAACLPRCTALRSVTVDLVNLWWASPAAAPRPELEPEGSASYRRCPRCAAST